MDLPGHDFRHGTEVQRPDKGGGLSDGRQRWVEASTTYRGGSRALLKTQKVVGFVFLDLASQILLRLYLYLVQFHDNSHWPNSGKGQLHTTYMGIIIGKGPQGCRV